MSKRLKSFSSELLKKKHLNLLNSDYNRTTYKSDKVTLFVKQLIILGFQREYKIIYDKAGSHFRVDFAHTEKRIIIELDGHDHTFRTRTNCDRNRDNRLKSLGWTVLRITYKEIENEL